MTSFETSLLAEIAAAKCELKKDESLFGFTLTITASGRIDGDVDVSFTLGGRYGEQSVTSGSLAPAIAEFLRRRGWQERHAPLCLPNVETAKSEVTPVDE